MNLSQLAADSWISASANPEPGTAPKRSTVLGVILTRRFLFRGLRFLAPSAFHSLPAALPPFLRGEHRSALWDLPRAALASDRSQIFRHGVAFRHKSNLSGFCSFCKISAYYS